MAAPIRRTTLTLDRNTLDTIRKATIAASKPVVEEKPAAQDQVRVLRLDEYKEAAITLAHAFKQDWVAMYVINVPDREHWTEEQKWELHVAVMEYLVYATILNGVATTVGPNYGAVALWMPPGKNMDDMWCTMRSGMWRLHYQLSREGKTRWFDEFMPLLHDTKMQVLGERDDNSWYLVYLGTRPEYQGQGLAKKLIREVTDKADAEGLPVYLESSNPRNPVIYRKYGFSISRTIHLTRDSEKDIYLDIMVREPNPIQSKEMLSSQEKATAGAMWQHRPSVVDIVLA